MSVDIIVSLQGDDSILRFDLDERGKIGNHRRYELPGGPAPLVKGRYPGILYAGTRNTPGLAVLKYDEDTVQLVDTVALESDPCFIAVDRSGRYLFSTFYRAGMVTVHRIDDDGTVLSEPVQTVKTYKNAHSIWLSPDNTRAFVPHTGPNEILQLAFSADSGLLSPDTTYHTEVPPAVEPRHIAMDQSGSYLYCANEAGSSVTTYRWDKETTSLVAMSTRSTLPESYIEENSCAQIRLRQDGKMLYVANRGHDSVAVFAIDKENRLPVPVGHVHTEPIPRAIQTVDSGKFLLTAGLNSGIVSVYHSEPKIPVQSDSFAMGHTPMWILEL